MNKILPILLLAVLPVLSVQAADPAKAFVKEVTRVAKTQDMVQWRELYCTPHATTYAEIQALRNFTKAGFGEQGKVAKPGVIAQLSLCSAKQGATEKCLPIPVGEKDGRLCLH